VPAPATSAEVFGLDDGHYGLRVRTIFDDGSFSRWVESEILDTGTLLTPPPDVSGFKIATIGDLSTLSWDAVRVVGISHYEIRFASAESGLVAWNSASPLVPVVSTTSVQVPTMVGTYLIKAVHQSGMQSSGAALVESNIAALSGLNVVETFVEHPAFSGSKHNVTVEGGRLQLLTNNTMSKWPTLDVVDTLSAPASPTASASPYPESTTSRKASTLGTCTPVAYQRWWKRRAPIWQT
jgi:hypothetical protein